MEFPPVKSGAPAKQSLSTKPISMPLRGRPTVASAVAPSIQYPEKIFGVPQVLDTGTLTVKGQRVPLAGIEGFGGSYADQFRETLAQFGDFVECDRVGNGPSYDCRAGKINNLSAMDLRSGIARTNASATAKQKEYEAAAAAEHRGIWGKPGAHPHPVREP
jgi:endonuclease YncB( thermonuclease family)